MDEDDDSQLIVLYRGDDDAEEYVDDDNYRSGSDRCDASDIVSGDDDQDSDSVGGDNDCHVPLGCQGLPPSARHVKPAVCGVRRGVCVLCCRRLRRGAGASLLCDRSPSSGRALSVCFTQLLAEQLQLPPPPAGGGGMHSWDCWWDEESRACDDCCRLIAYADSLHCQLDRLRTRLLLQMQLSVLQLSTQQDHDDEHDIATAAAAAEETSTTATTTNATAATATTATDDADGAVAATAATAAGSDAAATTGGDATAASGDVGATGGAVGAASGAVGATGGATGGAVGAASGAVGATSGAVADCLSNAVLVSRADQVTVSSVTIKSEPYSGDEEEAALPPPQLSSHNGEQQLADTPAAAGGVPVAAEINVEVLADEHRCHVCLAVFASRLAYLRHMLDRHGASELARDRSITTRNRSRRSQTTGHSQCGAATTAAIASTSATAAAAVAASESDTATVKNHIPLEYDHHFLADVPSLSDTADSGAAAKQQQQQQQQHWQHVERSAAAPPIVVLNAAGLTMTPAAGPASSLHYVLAGTDRDAGDAAAKHVSAGGAGGGGGGRHIRQRQTVTRPPAHLVDKVEFDSAETMRDQLEPIVRYPRVALGHSRPVRRGDMRRIAHLLSDQESRLLTVAPSGACNRCGLVVDSLEQLQQHKLEVHSMDTGVPHGVDARQFLSYRGNSGATAGGKCTICNKYVRHRLQRHMDAHECRGDTTCPLCRKQFSRRDVLDSHIKRVHIRERNFVCGQCGKTFVSLYSMRRHQLIHSNAYRFHCQHCCAGFRQKSQLVLHMRRRHGLTVDHQLEDIGLEVDAAAAVATDTSGEAAAAEAAMEAAVAAAAARWDDNQLRFMCQECGGAFVRRRALTIHMRTVHGVENVVYEDVQVHVTDGDELELIDQGRLTPALRRRLAAGGAIGSVLLASSADPTTVYIDTSGGGGGGGGGGDGEHMAVESDGVVVEAVDEHQTVLVDADGHVQQGGVCDSEARAVVAAAVAAARDGAAAAAAGGTGGQQLSNDMVHQCEAVYVNVDQTLEQIVEEAEVFVADSSHVHVHHQEGATLKGGGDSAGSDRVVQSDDGQQFRHHHHMSAEEAVQMVQETTVVTDDGNEWW